MTEQNETHQHTINEEAWQDLGVPANAQKETAPDLISLVGAVELWAIGRGLNLSDSKAQFTKTVEEVGEIASALCRNDIDLLKDSIGDVIVTLIILAQQNNTTIDECLNLAYKEIANRKGKTVNGVFVKESDLNE